MALPDLKGNATLNVAEFRAGLSAIMADLKTLGSAAKGVGTVKLTAQLAGQQALKNDLDTLSKAPRAPVKIGLELDAASLGQPKAAIESIDETLKRLQQTVRTTRNLWQVQALSDDQAAASSANLRDELLRLAAAEGTTAEQILKATQAAAQAQRTLDQSRGDITKGGFAFNTSLGILQAIQGLGGPLGSAAGLLGRYVSDGLTAGMKARAPEVGRGAQDLGDDVLQAIRDKLAIRSPSQKMIEVGGFITSGLIIGIKTNQKDVLNAAADLGAGIPGAVADAASGSGDGVNLGGAFTGSFLADFKGVLSDLPELFKQATGETGAAATDLADTVTTNVAPAFEGLSAGFEKASAKLEALPPKAAAATTSTANLGAATVDASNGTEALAGFLGAAAAGVTLFGAALTIAVPKAIEFEDSISKIGTESDLTPEQLTALGDGLLKLAGKVGQGAQSLSEAAYDVVGAGVKGAEDVEGQLKLTEIAAKAATAGATTTKTSVQVITAALNAYGLTADHAQKVSDVLFKTTTLGNVTFEQLAQTTTILFPLANTLGVSIEELGASMGILTKNGVPAAQAATGIQTALSAVLKPSSEASTLAKSLGLNFSAQGLRAQGLAGFLNQVQAATKGNIEEMGTLFGSTDAVNAVFALTANGAKDFAAGLADVRDSAGATEGAFQKQINTAKGAQAQFSAAGEALQIGFGLRFLPILTKATQSLTYLLVNVDQIGKNGVVQFALFVGGGTLAIGTAFRLAAAIREAATAQAILNGVMNAGGVLAYVRALGGATVSLGLFSGAATVAGVAAAPLLSTALALGAAFVGWKLGEQIANFKAFSNGAETLGDQIQNLGAIIFYGADPKEIAENQAVINEGRRRDAASTKDQALSAEQLTAQLTAQLKAEDDARTAAQRADAVRAQALETIKAQKTALTDLDKVLGERTASVKLAGQSELSQQLAKIGSDLDGLRIKLKAAFTGDDANPKLLAGLALLDKQRAFEVASARAKYQTEAVKAAQDGATAATRAEVEAMRDGAPKVAAQRAAELAQVREDTAKQAAAYADFPKQRAQIEADGQRVLAAKRLGYAAEDEVAARAAAARLASEYQNVADAQATAAASASTAQVALINLQTQRAVMAAGESAELVARAQAEGARRVAVEEQGAADTAYQASRARLLNTTAQTLADTKLSAADRLLIEAGLQGQLADLDNKRLTDDRARLTAREKAEQDSAERIRAARVAAAFVPVAAAGVGIADLAFTQGLAKSDAERLANEQQQQTLRVKRLALQDAALVQARTEGALQGEINKALDDRKTLQRDVLTGAQREADLAEKIRAARVAAVFETPKKAGDTVAELSFQQGLAKTDAARLGYQQGQTAALAAQLGLQDSAILKARALTGTAKEIAAAEDDRRKIARDLQTSQAAELDLREKIRTEILDTFAAVRDLARVQAGYAQGDVSKAQAAVAQATAATGEAYRVAQPYLDAFRSSQVLGIQDFDKARAAIGGLTSALSAERSALDTLKSKYDEQRGAVAGLADDLQVLNMATGGGQSALALSLNSASVAYESARKLLADGNGSDPVALQKLADGFKDAYTKRTDATRAYYEGLAVQAEKARDRLSKLDATERAAAQVRVETLTAQIQLGRTLAELNSAPVQAEAAVAAATDRVAEAYRVALPLLLAYADGTARTPAQIKAATDATGELVARLKEQQDTLKNLRTEYDQQKVALTDLNGSLAGFGKDVGSKSLLENTLKFNQSTYNEAKAALNSLLSSGDNDPVKLQAAVKNLRAGYDDLKGTLTDLGQGSRLRVLTADLPGLLKRTGDAASAAAGNVAILGANLTAAERAALAQSKGLDAATIDRVKSQLAPERELSRQRAELQAAEDERAAGTAAKLKALEDSAASARNAGQAALDALNVSARASLVGLQSAATVAAQTTSATGAALSAAETSYGASLRNIGTLSAAFIATLQAQMTDGGYAAGQNLARGIEAGYGASMGRLAVPGIQGAGNSGGGPTYINLYLQDGKPGNVPTELRTLLYQLRDAATLEVSRGNL